MTTRKTRSAAPRNPGLSAAMEAQPLQASVPDRQLQIAELAYFRAEKRGFAPGLELQDWLEAESEVDATS